MQIQFSAGKKSPPYTSPERAAVTHPWAADRFFPPKNLAEVLLKSKNRELTKLIRDGVSGVDFTKADQTLFEAYAASATLLARLSPEHFETASPLARPALWAVAFSTASNASFDSKLNTQTIRALAALLPLLPDTPQNAKPHFWSVLQSHCPSYGDLAPSKLWELAPSILPPKKLLQMVKAAKRNGFSDRFSIITHAVEARLADCPDEAIREAVKAVITPAPSKKLTRRFRLTLRGPY